MTIQNVDVAVKIAGNIQQAQPIILVEQGSVIDSNLAVKIAGKITL